MKTASYGAVVVVGLGVTAGLLFYCAKELFGGDSPNAVYQRAADKCLADPKVKDLLGEPIKAFGEETSRRRRKHAR